MKDEDFPNKFLNLLRNITQLITPPNMENKQMNPIDMIQNVIGFVNKIIDGVVISTKNLPPFIATIYEVNRDAQRAFDDGRYSDFIMLKYKGTEIFYRSFYQDILNKEIKEDDQINLSVIIKEIEDYLNLNSGILRELNDWRKIRNKIVHEHLKVDRKKAEEAKPFFNKLYKLFETYIKQVKIS